MFRSAADSRAQKIRIAVIVAAINALGFFILFVLVVPRHLALQTGGVFGIGLGLTAYSLGMRHAFDADHIAAIDNTTRKLQSDHTDSHAVGFFFSLGHSTVVMAMGVLVAVGVKGFAGVVTGTDSSLHRFAETWGPAIAGLFLLTIAFVNLVVLKNIARAFARMRRGEFDEAEFERDLGSRGLLSRIYSRSARSVTSAWHMYPLGVMFGLGFDTASEIALLLLAGGAAAGGLPSYAVLCLPILFTAGMTLFDSLNSVFMDAAYAWAFEHPARKLFYDFTMTGLSVISAFAIGTLSLLHVSLEGMQYVGYALVAAFAVIGLAALAVWKFGDVERRLSQQTRG